MGEFKDENGKTRVGKFLEGLADIAPGILQVAGTVTGIDGLKNLAEVIKGSSTMRL